LITDARSWAPSVGRFPDQRGPPRCFRVQDAGRVASQVDGRAASPTYATPHQPALEKSAQATCSGIMQGPGCLQYAG